jgi:hypothetical protein
VNGGLTDDGDVLALVGGDDPGEQLDTGECGHDDLREHEVEGVGAPPHHLPRLHPVCHRSHCRPPRERKHSQTPISPTSVGNNRKGKARGSGTS